MLAAKVSQNVRMARARQSRQSTTHMKELAAALRADPDEFMTHYQQRDGSSGRPFAQARDNTGSETSDLDPDDDEDDIHACSPPDAALNLMASVASLQCATQPWQQWRRAEMGFRKLVCNSYRRVMCDMIQDCTFIIVVCEPGRRRSNR